jgi:DNA mismatch repair protein MutL
MVIPPKIDLLPEHLIDQIKAGEVIERPGNLIKEIIENAIDARASKLEIAIRNNGLDLISLRDDGHGMHFTDLPLAFSRHATSKINRFEDLYQLRSFGFRGEALASIAAISKIQCLTKTSDSASPSEIRIEGGQIVFHGERQSSSFDAGTELIIRDLFFNTPARLKFIQGQQSEKNFIRKILFAFVLSNPEIEFQIKIDEAEKELYPSRKSLLDRIKDIFPKSPESVLSTSRMYEELHLNLLLVPGTFKAPMRLQNIYINKRFVLDKQLHRVLTNSLVASLGHDDFHYILSVDLPPDSIDVNVHPNKTIIKIMELSKLISLITSSIKEIRPRQKASDQSLSTSEISPFFTGPDAALSLQQERHHYNMEGVFSPHHLPIPQTSELIWIGNFFLRRDGALLVAVSATKLLEVYVKTRMQKTAPSIPLLVSEPFATKGLCKDAIKILSEAGAEAEHLGPETLVLRSIPEWMNGFPLKEILNCLLYEKGFSNLVIHPPDWSTSTWEEMLSFFSAADLTQMKITCDLQMVLRKELG